VKVIPKAAADSRTNPGPPDPTGSGSGFQRKPGPEFQAAAQGSAIDSNQAATVSFMGGTDRIETDPDPLGQPPVGAIRTRARLRASTAWGMPGRIRKAIS